MSQVFTGGRSYLCCVVLAVLLTGPHFLRAQEPDHLGLAATPSKILGDHLQLNLPKGTRIEPRGHSIMAADEPDSDETRAVLDVGRSRMVLMAEELYAMIPDDFAAGVK